MEALGETFGGVDGPLLSKVAAALLVVGRVVELAFCLGVFVWEECGSFRTDPDTSA